MHGKRTDLAVEARELWRESATEETKLAGVAAQDETKDGFTVTTVRILDDEGAAALGKPVGSYITLELDKLIRREDDAFDLGVNVLSREIADMMKLTDGASVLVVGLGNKAITADAIGPETLKSVLVTNHLVDRLPDIFGEMRRVSALESGVLGTTGIESADVIKAVVSRLRPDGVIVVDALASRRMARICRTVQLADTGIVPGSGVGNSREAINAETLGVPVLAIGVPTVVDAGTLAADVAEQAGITVKQEDLDSYGGKMIVTPKEIDENVRDISKFVGYAINLALHRSLSADDVTMLL
jgi:spore protease